MPNLEAQAAWVPVREIGIELARGGPNGNMNEQAKALLARTEFLNQQKASKSEIVQGHYEFNTYAEFNAIKSTLPLNCTVIINEMPTGTQTWGQGTNRWNGTTLTKSAHDPLTQAKADATTKANAAEANAKAYADTRSEEAKADIRAESSNTDANLEMAVDKNDNAYRLVNADGEEFLAGMDKSVQESFKCRPNGLAATSQVEDIEQVLDADENIVQRTDYRGAFYISPGGAPVQHYTRQALSDSSVKSDFNAPLKTSHEKYAASVKTAVLDLQSQCLPFIEPPLLLVQNTVNIPETILSNIQVADDNPVARLPFPNAIGGSVHPYALQLRKPLYGYKNLLLDTNHLYGGEGDENPVMFGTNDWVNFDLIPDVKQPMRIPTTGKEGRPRDSFLSDSWFHYDPLDGALVWGVREVMRNAEEPGTRLYTTKTYDGVHWSAQQQLNIPNPVGGTFAAPAVLYNFDDNLFHMWASPSRGLLNHYTSLNGIDWIEAGQTNFNSEHGFAIWHQEVKYLGGKYFICADSQGSTANVRVGFSTDGVTWNMSPDIVTNPRAGIYKPTFTLDFDGENKVKFTFMWAHWAFGLEGNNTTANPMELYIQPTGWIDLTTI
jgi:hypothetical protein